MQKPDHKPLSTPPMQGASDIASDAIEYCTRIHGNEDERNKRFADCMHVCLTAPSIPECLLAFCGPQFRLPPRPASLLTQWQLIAQREGRAASFEPRTASPPHLQPDLQNPAASCPPQVQGQWSLMTKTSSLEEAETDFERDFSSPSYVRDGSKADIGRRPTHVRCSPPKADIRQRVRDVRFVPKGDMP